MNNVENTVAHTVNLVGFQVSSAVKKALDVDTDYNLVKGDNLQVFRDEKMLHSDVRALIVLSNDYHIIRDFEGAWWLCTPDGERKHKSPLKKKNLEFDGHVLMFDERGKLRLGQHSAFYANLTI